MYSLPSGHGQDCEALGKRPDNGGAGCHLRLKRAGQLHQARPQHPGLDLHKDDLSTTVQQGVCF